MSSTSSTMWYWSSSSLVCQGRRQSGSSATDRRRWTQPSNWRRIRWWHARGSANPYQLSLSLHLYFLLLPLPLDLSCFSGPVLQVLHESRPEGGVGPDKSTLLVRELRPGGNNTKSSHDPIFWAGHSRERTQVVRVQGWAVFQIHVFKILI